ncbi:SDR family oxidoreductase [Dongia sedimenti]|uniref:SDR family oxidoreductase n=1 Tax=Dongia sedimenti TaxID=3064282 RepID=A0ABU0YI89_9PROT|nr:SDR family oxidoreductase [Rhodospirillaceae bacterium R-7]
MGTGKANVLVLGATGFIGRRIVAAIAQAGYAPVGAVRRPALFSRMFPGCRAIACDLARDVEPEIWQSRLADIDAVINCAGVLSDAHSHAVHVAAPKALHTACVAANVRRVVHISAISAAPEAGTPYAEEKRAAEIDLQSRDLDWVILRPSLVFAEGTHGGTSALRGLAAFPFVIPVPGTGEQRFSPIHAEDLSAAVVRLLAADAPVKQVLEPCGPESMSLREIVVAWRAWLGLRDAPVLQVPMALVRASGRVFDRLGGGPLSTTAIRQIEHGNAGDGPAFAAAIGLAPRSMRAWLMTRPSSVQDKWHARLCFLRPILRWVLGLSWLASGVIGLLASTDLAAAILGRFGAGALAAPVQWATSLLDIGIAVAILARRWPGAMLAVQLVTVGGYTLVISIADPALWAEPLGPLVKNAAFLALAATVAALEDDR